MAYRNQNYMTNQALKEQADQAQKDYVAPQEEQQEETFVPETYYFKSYDSEEKTTQWGTGSAETTGVSSNGFTEIEVKINEPEESFVGRKFYIDSNAKTDGTVYQLYTDAGQTGANIYVEISKTEFTN